MSGAPKPRGKHAYTHSSRWSYCSRAGRNLDSVSVRNQDHQECNYDQHESRRGDCIGPSAAHALRIVSWAPTDDAGAVISKARAADIPGVDLVCEGDV